jgi:small multidrug resistance family-3 protein
VKTISLYVIAAAAEIGGCYAFWMWQKLNRSPLWGMTGTGALIAFAWLLTQVNLTFAGRAYAAYGGIYIAATLVWLWLVEGVRPDRWDFAGVTICLIGAAVIVFAPRATS